MLRNGGSGAACSLHQVQFDARPLARARRQPTPASTPRSQPPPSPPLLRKGGSGGGCSLRSHQFTARPLARAQPRRPRPRARPPQSPPPPVLRNGGSGDLRLAPWQFNQHSAAATTNAHPATNIQPPRTRSRFAPSNTPCQFARPRSSQRARLPSTPACHAVCFRSRHVERPTASRPRTPAAKPTPVEPQRPRTASFGRVYDAVVAPASP